MLQTWWRWGAGRAEAALAATSMDAVIRRRVKVFMEASL
jgi:hypothetical protein